MQFRYTASMHLYRNLYSLFGSYELLKLKFQLDLPLYYHLWLSEFMQDLHLDEEFLANQVQEQQQVLNSLSTFSQLFQKVERHLHTINAIYRGNLGNFTDALEGIEWVREIGKPLTTEQSLTRLRGIFRRGYEQAHDLLETGSSEPRKPILSSIS